MNGALNAQITNEAEQLTPRHVDEFFQLWYHGSKSFSLITISNYIFQCIFPTLYSVKSYIAETVVCQGNLEK